MERAIEHEKNALKALDSDRAKAKSELEQSLADLESAAASSTLDPGLDTASADLRQAINKDKIAIDNLAKQPGRARAKINEAIVKKEAAVDIYTPSTHVAADAPPTLKPVQATFEEDARATFYEVSATDQDGDRLSYDWTLTPPKDDPSCNNHGDLKSAKPEFIWHHSSDDERGHGDHCHHKTPQHNGTVTVTVSDKGWTCTASYGGTLTGTAQPKPCQRRK